MKRMFLSRIRCETVAAKDMFTGNTVIVFSRRLLIEGAVPDRYKKVLTFGCCHYCDSFRFLGGLREGLPSTMVCVCVCVCVCVSSPQVVTFRQQGGNTTKTSPKVHPQNDRLKRPRMVILTV